MAAEKVATHDHDHSHGHGHAHGRAVKKTLRSTVLELEDDVEAGHDDHHHHTPKASLPELRIDAVLAHDRDDGHAHGHAHGAKDAPHDDHHHDHRDDDHADGALGIDESAVHKLKLACLTSSLFMLMQFLGGYYAGSLAIMTDAAHLLSDVASFLVSLFAIYVGARPANARMPFGYHRAEVLGALISVVIIWVLTGGLLYAAVMRLIEQSKPDAVDSVDGQLMFMVSSCGLIVNLVLMRILGHGHSHGGGGHGHSHGGGGHGHAHGHGAKAAAKAGDHHGHGHGHGTAAKNHQLEDDLEGGGASAGRQLGVQPSPNTLDGSTYLKTPMSAVALIDTNECDDEHSHHSTDFENINVRAAYIHALGDFIQSLGVCVAGALIWYKPSWQMADPITTLLFSCLVLATTYGIFTRSVVILMEGAPVQLNLERVEKQVRALDAVYDCHDLRVWSLTDGRYAASVHVLANGDHKAALQQTQQYLKKIGVHMQTVQVETPADFDWEREGDSCCMNTTFSTSEVMMSVPRASTCKASAAARFTIDDDE